MTYFISLFICSLPSAVKSLVSIEASIFELILVSTRSFVGLVVSLFSLSISSEFSLLAISMLPLPNVARVHRLNLLANLIQPKILLKICL